MLNSALSTMLKIGTVGGLGVLTLSDIIEQSMKKYDTETLKPIDTVSIIMPSYNEETFIEIAASSIKNQSIIQQYPQYFEFILADSCSTDNTIELARPYVDKIIIVPRGKLTARNDATVQATGNIIVSVDADTYYPYYWLNTLLEPYNDYTNPIHENVVGTYGSTFDYTMPNVPGQIFTIAETLYSGILNKNRMTGRNSALYKHAFYLAGKFDESIDQFYIWSVFAEEEKMFGNRLSKFGKIVYKLNASCYHLGGFKSLYRVIGNKDLRDKHGFGTYRF